MITGEQLKAARALIRWDQKDLARHSKVSLPSVKRLEALRGPLRANVTTVDALINAFDRAGIEFIDANGGGPGVRLKTIGGADRQMPD